MVIIPLHTHNIAGTGHGVLRCTKVDYRTHTHTTRFGKPMGFPAPMPNLSGKGGGGGGTGGQGGQGGGVNGKKKKLEVNDSPKV